ncbi:hypothetical protein [Calothrix sp. PCC 7507]|uniref:hypothetical protein n=1 Tax=Calothrix sp. PCC 7507 TaxID=99598 RepID=UPI001181BCD6|nr:hypothetical protein [Calothrix sp. PCC 7507]
MRLLFSAKALRRIVGMKYIKGHVGVGFPRPYRAIATLTVKLRHRILRESCSGHYLLNNCVEYLGVNFLLQSF